MAGVADRKLGTVPGGVEAIPAEDLKAHTDLNMHALALVDPHDISNDEGSFKSLPIGKQRHDRYSHKAPQALREARDAGRVDEAKAAL